MDEDTTPLRDWLARCDGTVALVFTDLIDSTVLIFATETVNYTRALNKHRARGARLARELGGRLIDAWADELLVAFPRVTEAYSFASQLFRDPGVPGLRIRSGVHYGAVRAEGEVLIGRNVHYGARVMMHAVESEFWVSDAAKSALELESPQVASDISWIRSEACELKGVPNEQRLWRAA